MGASETTSGQSVLTNLGVAARTNPEGPELTSFASRVLAPTSDTWIPKRSHVVGRHADEPSGPLLHSRVHNALIKTILQPPSRHTSPRSSRCFKELGRLGHMGFGTFILRVMMARLRIRIPRATTRYLCPLGLVSAFGTIPRGSN